MHHALEIEEILLNVFQYICQVGVQPKSDLAALARTCRALNGPAMDVLWKEMDDLSILAKCLPDASHRFDNGLLCSFHRSLTQNEWDVLYNCTRRIRTISLGRVHGLATESLKMLANPPMTGTLFPNVCSLRCHPYNNVILSLLRTISFPSLVSLQVTLSRSDLPLFGNLLEPFAKTSSRLTRLSVYHYSNLGNSKIDPSFLCQWQNLEIVEWSQVRLDLTSLAHLSCMPALIKLSFTLVESLPDQISLCNPPLVFSNLLHLQISSESLNSPSQFLTRTRLPAVTTLTVYVNRRPSTRDLAFFFASVQTSGLRHTIKNLHVAQSYDDSCNTYAPPGNRPVLHVEELEPCMAFSNLRCIHFDFEYRVGLSESDLLMLTSAWPHLEEIAINSEEWGWNSSGITPDGLLRFLQTRPLITRIALAIDTRGYTRIPDSSAGPGFTLPRLSLINVVDSFIENESVRAIAAFFASFAQISTHFDCSGDQSSIKLTLGAMRIHQLRWNIVHSRIKQLLFQKHVESLVQNICNTT